MRPILLGAHERSLTCVKFNRDGDLLFTAAKDATPCVWYADNGERLGTYDGHSGAVWDLDVSWDSELLLTGAADSTVKLWRVGTGEELATFTMDGPVRFVAFAEGDRKFLVVSEPLRSGRGIVTVFDIAEDPAQTSQEPSLIIDDTGHRDKISGAYWLPLNEQILTAGKDGFFRRFDANSGEPVGEPVEAHSAAIKTLSFNKDKTLLITGSADNTSKLFTVDGLEHLKTYQTDRPVNAACISPIKDHIMLGGGQDAMSVTTTAGRVGKFEARIFHLVYQGEIGRIKGHFGPINCMDIAPDGLAYASGGEDGFVRLHHFDDSYLQCNDVNPDLH